MMPGLTSHQPNCLTWHSTELRSQRSQVYSHWRQLPAWKGAFQAANLDKTPFAWSAILVKIGIVTAKG